MEKYETANVIRVAAKNRAVSPVWKADCRTVQKCDDVKKSKSALGTTK